MSTLSSNFKLDHISTSCHPSTIFGSISWHRLQEIATESDGEHSIQDEHGEHSIQDEHIKKEHIRDNHEHP